VARRPGVFDALGEILGSMGPGLPVLASVGVGAVVLRKRSEKSSGKTARDPAVKPSGGWIDPDAPRRIRAIAAPIEAAANWPGLGDFLVAKAWTESRGNPKAGSDTGNAARGWFGLRPKSARVRDLAAFLTPASLKQERPAVALAAWYAHRMHDEAAPGQIVDWLAIARGWAYPRLVSDVDEAATVKGWLPGERSRQVRFNLTHALTRGAGVAPTFMYEPAFPANYSWPGIDQVLGLAQGAQV
jgi:hypothetical protein